MQNTVVICPLCSDKVDKLLYRFHLDGERHILSQIRQQHPTWSEGDGICGRCIDYYNTLVILGQQPLPGIGPHFPIKSADDYVILPTALRLDADPRFSGEGVTICFIDSGFYLHPDLTHNKDRIKEIIDITNLCNKRDDFRQPTEEAWHGTMTSVVCAGDGFLSKGLYKGIASNAELILLKVQDEKKGITVTNLERALAWVLCNQRRYNIKIVNISLGVEEDEAYKQSSVGRLVEQLVEHGIVVVAAAGNNGDACVKPPANAPSVITVGGLDDRNELERKHADLYHSSFGSTADAFMKPELVAPANWVAAPILPQSKEQTEAQILYDLLDVEDGELLTRLPDCIANTQLNLASVNDAALVRQAIRERIQSAKYISRHYMHVDGTSFAGPIVSSVIAQLFQLNPSLTPAMIRNILFSSAKRIQGFPAERQGFGVINPRMAILKILRKEISVPENAGPAINAMQRTITFSLQHSHATQVSLSGNFNQWNRDELLLEPGMDGIWKIDIPLLPPGKYQYKFLIDEKDWMEDITNPYREPDGFNGFNSLFTV